MNIENIECGHFPNLKSRGVNRPLLSILDEIKNGKWQNRIEGLRSLLQDQYKKEKKRLPAFLVSATTENGKHGRSDLKEHTGLLQVDVDLLKSLKEAGKLREQLALDPHVLAAWVSPSGLGVKLIVRIPPSFRDHKTSFGVVQRHFRDTFRLEIDSRCSDPSRLCFLGFDPKLVLKSSAHPFELSAFQTEKVDESSSANASTTSLHPTTTTTSYILHNTVFIDYPNLKPLFETLVAQRFRNLQPGHRNDALVEMVPILTSAIAPKFILPFTEEFFLQNRRKFRDPLEQHQIEAESIMNGTLADYGVKELSESESEAYCRLKEDQQIVFRICRSLAMVEDELCPPPKFFLSAEKLGARIGKLDMQADRLLKGLTRLGVIDVVRKGERRREGTRPRATTYRWALNFRQA